MQPAPARLSHGRVRQMRAPRVGPSGLRNRSAAPRGRRRPPGPVRVAFAGADAPCHVSFLAPDVNVEMQNFLGPLLPVARFLKIPVLDFDKYGLLFDAERTAETCVPAATSFLRQYVIRG